jgi:hypothetical protein
LTRTSISDFCPYCGEPLELLVDAGDLGQEYIEDCEVCCQPMIVEVCAGQDELPAIALRREND